MDNIDLNAAVSAGVLRSDQADALRRFDDTRHDAPGATEERFALVSGFADIMAAAGFAMVAWFAVVAMALFPPAAIAMPAACWWAARYFTGRRRMMLTSLVIFATFALSAAMGALAIALFVLGISPLKAAPGDIPHIWATMVASLTTLACWIYWRRFSLPLAFAAFAVAAINVAINLIRLLIPAMPALGVDIVSGLAGPLLFAWAMWWDVSDVRRETIRSDVAFWLHLAAGFQIAKSGMALILGPQTPQIGWSRLFFTVADPGAGQAAAVLLLFLLFAAVALIIDRRSLLTSGMGYAVPALAILVGGGATLFGPALLVAGLCLIGLAVKWTRLRELLLAMLPRGLTAQLPRPQLKAFGPRPVY